MTVTREEFLSGCAMMSTLFYRFSFPLLRRLMETLNAIQDEHTVNVAAAMERQHRQHAEAIQRLEKRATLRSSLEPIEKAWSFAWTSSRPSIPNVFPRCRTSLRPKRTSYRRNPN